MIQIEGRVYRRGLRSNAIIELPMIGTQFEQWRYRDVVSQRTGTAENLAMGTDARDLRNVLRESYLDPRVAPPADDQGVGGKAADRYEYSTDLFSKAKTYYFKRGKKTQRSKSAEGTDYFSTPEPIGLSMVQWADIKPGDKALEPSGGHGAIARFLPEYADNTAIELSGQLVGELGMVTNGKVLQADFYDHHVVNKYHSIVMNPPFGHAGNDALKFVDKGFKHLRNGGRMVAVIPRGKMDERLTTWLTEKTDAHLVAEVLMPAVMFERAGTQVSTRVIVIDKNKRGEAQTPRRIDLSEIADVNQLFDRVQEIEVKPRPDVTVDPKLVGMYEQAIELDGKAYLDVSEISRQPGINANKLKQLADRFNAEIHKDKWDDTIYRFAEAKDATRFYEAVLDTVEHHRAGVALDTAAPVFSMVGDPGNGEGSQPLSIAEVNAVINRVVPKQLRKTVHVVPTLFDLPVEVMSRLADGFDVHDKNNVTYGIHGDGQTYIIHENARSELGLENTLLHEMMHGYIHGNKSAKELTDFAHKLYFKMGGAKGIAKLVDLAGFPIEHYAKQYQNATYDQRVTMVVDELLAHAAGSHANDSWPDTVLREIYAFWGRVREWLRSAGFTRLANAIDVTPDNFNVADLEFLLKQLKKQGFEEVKHNNVSLSVAPRRQGVAAAQKGAIDQSAAFKRWFGNSKVVDAQGKPLVVYHGSPAGEIESFESASVRKSKDSTRSYAYENVAGLYFSKRADYAAMYAGKDAGATVYPVYLSLKNPLVVGGAEPVTNGVKGVLNRIRYGAKRMDAERELNRFRDGKKTTAIVTAEDIAILKSAGYDGIINENDHEIIVFNPEQIKSATGNNGDYDANNADIRFSMVSRGTQAVQDGITALQQARLDGLGNVLKPSKIWQAIKLKWPDLRPAMLATLPRNYLEDIAGNLLPSMKAYNKQVAQMEADRNGMLTMAHGTADKWRGLAGKDSKANQAMAELMHEATLIGVDPSKSEYKPLITPAIAKVLLRRAAEFIKSRNGEAVAVARGMQRRKRIQEALEREPNQQEAYKKLRAAYLALPVEFQQLFTDVRDGYKEANQQRKEALEARIKDLIADKRVSAAQIALMQEEFELNELSGVYLFPVNAGINRH